MSRKKLNWSSYQDNIFDFVRYGKGHGFVQARAGSGKSTTALEAVWHTHRASKVMFLAFNKAIADYLKPLVANHVDVYTFHAFGYYVIRRKFGPRIFVDEMKVDKILRGLLPEKERDRALEPLKRAVSIAKQYLTEDPDEIMDLVAHHGFSISRPDIFLENVDKFIQPTLEKCRTSIKSIDFDDMCWLPMVLDIKSPKYDIVFVDECQDVNRGNLLFLRKILERKGRLIGIGDSRQCQPAGSMIMRSSPIQGGGTRRELYSAPIEDIRPGDSVVTYMRHGAHFILSGEVTAVQKRPYEGRMFQVSAGGNTARCTPTHKWLVRWNKDTENSWVVYLMRCGTRFRIGQCAFYLKSADSSQGRDFGLSQRCRIERANEAWVLEVVDSKEESLIREAVYSARYGIPQTVFHPPSSSSPHHRGVRVINAIYSGLGDLTERAEVCLQDFGRSLDHPLYINQSVGRRQRQGRTTLFETAACNLLSGYMKIPVLPKNRQKLSRRNAPEWSVISVDVEEGYKGDVYSLDVAKHHKYVTHGMVTCNSIYGFRGSDAKAVETLKKDFHMKELPLPVSYRCPRAVIRKSQEIVPDIQAAPDAIEGLVRDISYLDIFDHIKSGDMVICRTTRPLIDPYGELVRRGVKAFIRGVEIGEQMIEFIQSFDVVDIEDLIAALKYYQDDEVKYYVKRGKYQAAQNAIDTCESIAALSNGVKNVMGLVRKIQNVFNDDETDGVILSTIHRAKGLEADNIWLLRPDLLPHPNSEKEWELEQEENLKYVAYTRAKVSLNIIGGPYPVTTREHILHRRGNKDILNERLHQNEDEELMGVNDGGADADIPDEDEWNGSDDEGCPESE